MTSGQFVSFLPDSYLDRTSRPIYALAFLLAFIVIYEVGIMRFHVEAFAQSMTQKHVQLVAFVWIQNALEFIGFSARMSWLIAPLVVIFILLGLQIASGKPWYVKVSDFIPMTIECFVLALPLIVLFLLLNRSQTNGTVSAVVLTANAAEPSRNQQLMMDLITGIGAGIYEELIFRLVLISLLMMLFQDLMGMQKNNAIFTAVLISAVLFSLHHHIFFFNGQLYRGDPFTMGKFVFRTLAGVYFAVLFAVRGFGIAAGTHSFYNIIAVMLKTLAF